MACIAINTAFSAQNHSITTSTIAIYNSNNKPPNKMLYFDLLPDHVLKIILSYLDIRQTNSMMDISEELKLRVLSRLNLTQLKFQNCMQRWQNKLNLFETDMFKRIQWPGELATLYGCSIIFKTPTDFQRAFYAEYFPLAATFLPRATTSLTYMQCIRRMSRISLKTSLTAELIFEFLKMSFFALFSLSQMKYYNDNNTPNPKLTRKCKHDFISNLSVTHKTGATFDVFLQAMYTDMMSKKAAPSPGQVPRSDLVMDAVHLYYFLSALLDMVVRMKYYQTPVEIRHLTKFVKLRELNVTIYSPTELQQLLTKLSTHNKVSTLHFYGENTNNVPGETDENTFTSLEKYQQLKQIAFVKVSFITLQSISHMISNSYCSIEIIFWRTNLPITAEEVCEMLRVALHTNKTIKDFRFNLQYIMKNRIILSSGV